MVKKSENLKVKKKGEPFYLRHSFNLFFVLLMLVLFFLKTIILSNNFIALETAPPLLRNLPNQKIPFGQGISTVNVGFNISNFLQFDVRAGKFELEGDLWFSFNPNIVPQSYIDDFQFDNGKILQKSEFESKLMGNLYFVVYRVRVEFFANLIDNLFPFNDHRIFLILKNYKLSPAEVHFEASTPSLVLEEGIQPFGWKPVNFEAESGYFKTILDKNDKSKFSYHPGVVFSFEFAKPGFRKIFIVLGPSTILFLIGLLSLLIHENSRAQLGVAICSLSGLIVYRFVMESLLPNVGYFTPTEYIYFIYLFSSFLALLFAIYEIEIPLNKRIKICTFYTLQILALSLFFISTWY